MPSPINETKLQRLIGGDFDVYADGPVHAMFGLSYANYFVMPRVILEHMPLEWQTEFVKLVAAIEERFDFEPAGSDVWVVYKTVEDAAIDDNSDPLNDYRRPDFSLLLKMLRCAEGNTLDLEDE